jgi:hypothetical protein
MDSTIGVEVNPGLPHNQITNIEEDSPCFAINVNKLLKEAAANRLASAGKAKE